MRVIDVVQNTSAEYLGYLEDHLEGRGIRFRYHRPFTSKGRLPEPTAVTDGLVILGAGPYGAGPGQALPLREAELELLKACLDAGRPVLAVGFGAQLLALATGGSVAERPLRLDLGLAHRSDEGALGGYLPAELPLVQYQRDAAVPPAAARVLARSAAGEALIWQLPGRPVFGFAGHPGMKRAMVEDLVMEFEEAPPDAAAQLGALGGLQAAIGDALVPLMTGLVLETGWMG
jgi:GMP synthase-like glutamine amidotransferase